MKVKNKVIIFFIVVFFSSFVLSACTKKSSSSLNKNSVEESIDEEIDSNIPSNVPIENFEKYINDDDNFSIMYPKDWEVKEEFFGTSAMFLSPLSSEKDIFQENLSIISEDLGDQKISLDEYTDLFVNDIKMMVTDVEVVSGPSHTKFLNKDAREIYYTGRQGQLDFEWHQVWIVEDDKAYITTFTSSRGEYESFEETTSYMISTFKKI